MALAVVAPDVVAPLGLDRLTAMKLTFVLYALLGLVGGLLYVRIPRRRSVPDTRAASWLGPSRRTVLKLAALFSLAAFAVVQSLLALWLFECFDMSLAAAGVFSFWTGVLSAFSFPVAAWLSRKIGLINTTVFTHIPSSIALMLAAIAPTRSVALALLRPCRPLADGRADTLVLRHGSSYVMAIVTQAERTAAAELHVRAAQSCRGGKAGRLPVRCLRPRPALGRC